MRRRLRLAAVVILGIVTIWNEWLSYQWFALKWSIDPISEHSLRILVVADPQLIGYHNENEFVGPLARWDSDRYLFKGFNLAVDRTQPDVLIFLGDLFDEGIESNEEEFEITVSRFYRIFELEQKLKRSFIFVAGDNDVGGEYEPVSVTRSNRFSRNFPNYTPYLSFCNYFNFSMINMFDASAELSSLCKFSTNSDISKVLISHMALRDPFSLYSKQVGGLMNIHPKITHTHVLSYSPRFIMAGHLHKAAIDNISMAPFSLTSEDLTNKFDIVRRNLNSESVVQLLFPTCSYRMGTPYVGYGFVVLKYATDEFSFSLLWLPCRFTHFMLYILILSFIMANIFLAYLFPCYRSRLKISNCYLLQ